MNYLRNRNAQLKTLTVSFGTQVGTGHQLWGLFDGANVKAKNALAEGEWDRLRGVWFAGEEIPASNYNFQPGALATGMTTGPQVVGPYFPNDVPHTRTATIEYIVPEGIVTGDKLDQLQNELKVIAETKKCPDFNSSGVRTDFSYSVNPAREIVELLETYCRLPNLPAQYLSFAHYWRSRIDWANWVDFRDFHNQTEANDYRTLENFDGFGLTARYYNGANAVNDAPTDYVQKFVHPNFDINYGSQPPAAGLTANNFSGKFTGYIKFPTTETYTFTVSFDDGCRFWLNGANKLDFWSNTGNGPAGPPQTFTFDATAGQYVPVEVHWNDGLVVGHLRIEVESASHTKSLLSSKWLYPDVEQKALYEVHIDFELPTHPKACIDEILYQSNSYMTEARGKLRFYSYEAPPSGQAFDSSNIDALRVLPPADRVQTEIYTAYEAAFRSLDMQYLEEPVQPVSIEFDFPTNQPPEKSKVIQMFNTTHWQARKILQMRARLDADRFPQMYELKTSLPKSYQTIQGDSIEVAHRKINEDLAPRTCLVREVVNAGFTTNPDGSSNGTEEVEPRTLIIQEFSNA